MAARRPAGSPPRNPDRTKGRLLRAASKLFALRGFDGVAVDEIVAAARVNKRMVYHYFGSKEDLYLAALTDVFGQLEKVEMEALDAALPAEAQLRRLVASYFDFLDDHPEFVRLLLWENLERGTRLSRHPEQVNKNPFLDRFDALLDLGLELGVFRLPVDRRHLAANLIGLCFIYYSNRYSLFQPLFPARQPRPRGAESRRAAATTQPSSRSGLSRPARAGAAQRRAEAVNVDFGKS